MNHSEPHKGVINIWTAFALYALLAGWAAFTLKGIALIIALIIVGGLAVKSYVHFLRSRLD